MGTPKGWDFCVGRKDLNNFQETMELWEGWANAFLMARMGQPRL